MLISSRELLLQARAAGTYIPAFNVYNLETAQAALGASRRAGRPVILAVGESYLQDVSVPVISGLIAALSEEHPYPVVLHLDHCRNIGVIEAAVENRFTSVMYDGSGLPLAENIANSQRVVHLAHGAGVTVEGELGCMNSEDGSGGGTAPDQYTLPGEAARYVRETGVDSLAVAIGNAHGLYRGVPKLNLDRLSAIYAVAGIPIVLHGCSGIPAEQIRAAAEIAVAKINVNTEIALAASRRVSRMLAGQDNVRFEKLMRSAREEMENVMLGFFK